MITSCFDNKKGSVRWRGFSIHGSPDFLLFLKTDVAQRSQDNEAVEKLYADLNALSTTGFAKDNLEKLLATDTSEERAWAIGENLAECLLTENYGIQWPWNMERDKRTPLASLPGADLVGFIDVDGQLTLAVGEVKTSSDVRCPPNVMSGKSGMTHQIEKLSCDLGLIMQLIKWLHPRCVGTMYEQSFKTAIAHFLDNDNSAIFLFGVLIRDTLPQENDLKARAENLSQQIVSPTQCDLLAYYLPCTISELPTMISEEEES